MSCADPQVAPLARPQRCPRPTPALPVSLGGALAVLLSTIAAVAADPDPPQQPPKPADGLTSLLDGKSLAGWKVVSEYDFRDHGKVYVKDGRLILEKGRPMTGARWTGKFPPIDYEVSLDAMRVDGEDFFCSVVFPIQKQHCSITFGGWGGSIVGLTNIDGEPAVENETCIDRDFENNRWYHLRFRVTAERIEAWIDKEKVIDFAHKDHKLTIRWEQDPLVPFGISSYETTGAIRNLTVRPLAAEQTDAAPASPAPNKTGAANGPPAITPR